MFELERNEMVGGSRKLYEELHNLFSSPNVIRMIDGQGMQNACGQRGMNIGFWWVSQKKKHR
jgi:hypothetical protein